MARLRDILFADEPAATTAAPLPQLPPAGMPTVSNDNKSAARRELSLSKQLTTINNKGGNSNTAESGQAAYQHLKTRIHTRLVESLDLNALMKLDGNAELETAIERTVHMLINEERLPLSTQERQHIAQDVLYETLGLGPLEPLLADGEINDILVNGANSVWIDRNGQLTETEVRFQDDNHLLHVINRIVSRVGRRVDESSPIVDARLPDGSRVNAIIPPLSIEGPILSIRRFRPNPFDLNDLIAKGTLSPQMAEFLENAVRGRLNILISGGTSAGKTTLLGVLSSYISERERIVTIEDTAELRLQQRHVVRLESRPSNIEGQGAVSQRELVKNALRMRPDRIVVGEVRGAEALDMLQAMNTGHEGSLTTVHANSSRDALSRLETLVLLGGVDLSQRSIREQMGSAFDLIIQIKRLSDGTRRIVSITEVTGVQEDVVSLQDIFEYRQTGTSADGKVQGMHVACGIRPGCETKLKEAGLHLSSDLFLETPLQTSTGLEGQEENLHSSRGLSNE
ncbi:MAG TPA: CpaF family protein [Candidatus Melainabacteria bacterium]|nr:CpaF family protein [Candidatus Melainabacteria bacterium]